MIQNQIGKAILGIPQSSANAVVQVELGWKPIRLLLERSKLKCYHRVNNTEFKGSELVPACMNWHLNNPTSIYLSRLSTLLQEHARTPQDLLSVTLRQLNQTHEQKVLSEIQTKVTLKLLPIPRKWWRVQPHVADSRWSRAISKFIAMNAVLGNRYSYRTADTVCHDGCSVLECPLCFSGSNNEFHLLLKCRTMQKHREDIKLRNGISLQAFLIGLQSTSSD